MLARVTLRQELGREPTDDEVGNQMKKLAKKTVAPPSLDAIIAAVEKGEEVRPSRRSIHVRPPTGSRYRKRTRGNSSANTMKRIYSGRSPSRPCALRRRKSTWW